MIQIQDQLIPEDNSPEWVGMPEFVQPKVEAFKTLIVRFDNREDYDAFARLIGQRLTMKTKSIWHPKLVRGKDAKKRYVSES